MADGMFVPAAIGLAVGIAFVGLFSSFSTSLPLRNDPAVSVDLERVPDGQIIEVVDNDQQSILGQGEEVYVDFSVSLSITYHQSWNL